MSSQPSDSNDTTRRPAAPEPHSEKHTQSSAITAGVYCTAAATLFVVIGICIAATWQGGVRVALAIGGAIIAAGICGYMAKAGELSRHSQHAHDVMEPTLRHRPTYNARGRIDRQAH